MNGSTLKTSRGIPFMFIILVLPEVLKLLLHNCLLKKNTALKKDIPTTLTSLRGQFSYFKTDSFSRFGSGLFIILYDIFLLC